MATIYLLEDDKLLNNGIQTVLEKDNHHILTAHTIAHYEQIDAASIDLFLLDINLPDGNGLDLAKKIRQKYDTPIIFLTANDTEKDMLAGYEVGADDYIAKPFSIAVLRQKVHVTLKRLASQQTNTFQYEALTIHFDSMNVQVSGKPIKLTPTEYKLLEFLAKNQGNVMTRAIILEALWDIDGQFIDENTLSVTMKRLRQKIGDDPKKPTYIRTIFGIGYMFLK